MLSNNPILNWFTFSPELKSTFLFLACFLSDSTSPLVKPPGSLAYGLSRMLAIILKSPLSNFLKYLKLKLLTINLATFQITNYKSILQFSMIILILVYLYYLKKNRENEIKE